MIGIQKKVNTLEGRVVLVTGASRGIGLATALAFGRAGAVVIGTATTEGGGQNITSLLAESDVRGQGMVLDVTCGDACVAIVKAITAEYGAPQVLVNNAGITRDNIFMRMKNDEWDKVLDTNLGSIFRMSKAVIRGMTKGRWGRIINISSVVASMGNRGQVNYAASKSGIEGFSRSLAREVGSRNITVNTVAPGFINTDMTRSLSDDLRDDLLKQIPVERLGEAEDIASVVAFLASDGAGYITGETLHVNGGMYMG